VTDGENYLKRCSPVLKGYREDGRSAIATSLMNQAAGQKNPPEKTPADHCHLAMRKASYAFIAGV
jgi:hypothetical protein